MDFKSWLLSESSEPDLAYLLAPASGTTQIGPERQIGSPRDGSVKFLSPHGSYRYVRYVGEKPVSALQIVSKDGKNGNIANVYTLPEYRKQGFARELLDRARQGFESITHSKDLSSLGAIWKGKVEA
jgi:ribosomal protein S18 acetylase RimI-like enzyme